MYRRIRRTVVALAVSTSLSLAVPLGALGAENTDYGSEYAVLTKTIGTITGPSGKETWYNLNMSGVIEIMRCLGYSEEEYPYWIRSDGAKMFGQYVMVAANLSLRPRGTVVMTSLGPGIVCDTGEFARYNTTQLDIAVAW